MDKVTAWKKRKFGMFIHWGLYSMLGGEWKGEPVTEGYSEQIQMWARIPHEDYGALTRQFNPTAWDPDAIARLARDAGMGHIVITTKHHDGFSMFHTRQSDYNIADSTPFGRDPIAELAEACQRHGVALGFYFSLVDWHAGHDFDPNNDNPLPPHIEELIVAQLRELLTRYGPVSDLWFDMSHPTPAQSKRFAGTVRELQPNCMINGRIWNSQEDYLVMGDNQIPDHKIGAPWQTPASIYHATWGYRRWQVRDDLEGKVRELTRNLVRIVSRGGVYLLNIGPHGDGSVVDFEADVLRGIGQWLERYGDTVLAAEMNPFEDAPEWGEITASPGRLNLFVTNPPADGRLRLAGLLNGCSRARLLGGQGGDRALGVSREGDDVIVQLPADLALDPVLPVITLEVEEPLQLRPPRVLRSNADGLIRVPREAWTDAYGLTGTHYAALRRTTIAKYAWVCSDKGGAMQLRMEARNRTESPVALRVEVAQKTVTADIPPSGSPASFDLGALSLPAGAAVSVRISRARPDYLQQDLDVDIEALTMHPRPQG